MKCIFCNIEKPEDQFSTEHVFPMAIGGSFKIEKSVCRDCNSELGQRIDPAITDHPLIRLIRSHLGLVGQKGNIRPFIGELVESSTDNKEDIKVKLTYDKREGGLHPRVVPKECAPPTTNDGAEWRTFIYDPEDVGSIESRIRSFYEKEGLPAPPPEDISHLCEYLREHPDGVECLLTSDRKIGFRGRMVKAEPNLVALSEDIDAVHCKRAVAKIAYELACEWLGRDYMEDPCGETLRRFVIEPSSACEDAVNSIISLRHIPVFDGPLSALGSSHMARICYSGNDLVCVIKIFNVIEACITLTHNRSAYQVFIPRRVDIDAKTGKCLATPLQGVVSRSGN
ncbi:HNH endonuclease [Desulfomonile tiedjei]|uniref:HNH endonuclease 5 domain-containing protein n=1 Tax=Desulfomonile tiedjei (strain ATCC 49306 / DSM 6799 / DCB-1) TaxID=706587 RepID=I4C965_DESTA|nr:HNH endonuclease [Desulfomonile tiedjei]AFM26106.1 hypothetical protein Desti_3454 [Desulfomonile tiedjei DSM 6799]